MDGFWHAVGAVYNDAAVFVAALASGQPAH